MLAIKDIIFEALLLAGVLNPGEEFEGYYQTKGLDILNRLLADWCKMGVYIPYTTKYSFQTTAGEYRYPVSPPIAEFMEGNVISSDNVQSALRWVDAKKQNLLNYTLPNNRPGRIFIDDDFDAVSLATGSGSSLIYLYPTPDAIYTVNLRIKQYFLKLSLTTEPADFPPYYEKVLLYQLAKDCATFWQEPLTAELMDEYKRLIKELKATVPKDLSVNTDNPFLTYRRFRPWGGYCA